MKNKELNRFTLAVAIHTYCNDIVSNNGCKGCPANEICDSGVVADLPTFVGHLKMAEMLLEGEKVELKYPVIGEEV
jgi:positive regulator of sigma E activity